jgi:protein-disulfide isomerase
VFIWAIVAGGADAPPAAEPTTNGPPATNRREAPLPAAPVPFDAAPTLGSEHAQVGIIEFSDFECPFCRKFAVETHPAIKEAYIDTGLVRLSFRHLPLERIHPLAARAANTAECANRQGRFWQMHDAIFERPEPLTESGLIAAATALGLRMEPFQHCLAGEAADRVRADTELARTLKVTGTPTFFLGIIDKGDLRVVRRVGGALPQAKMAEHLDAVIASATR